MARRKSILLTIIAVGIALVVVFGIVRHWGTLVTRKSNPWFDWEEIAILSTWNPPHYFVTDKGERRTQPPSMARYGFGWFLYETFIDSGPIGSSSTVVTTMSTSPLSRELHDHFRALTDACLNEPSFGNALKLLFNNVHLFARSVTCQTLSAIDTFKLGPLSAEERASLATVAKVMREAMGSPKTTTKIKAASHLIAALTEGDDFPKDGVSLAELARIPRVYPKERLTSFLSQYYLVFALLRRERESEALRVAEQAIAEYRGDIALHDLSAYKHLEDIVKRQGKPPPEAMTEAQSK